jgi:glycosyltransferase involved in cell wall biosynthesis
MGEVTIIIPVKDEEVGLEFLLDDYRSSSLKDIHDVTFIFVIDKRTSDSSKKIASEFSENIIDQEETTGKGSAVRQAIDVWRKNPTQLIVFLDADGSYSFDSVIKILDSLEEGADLVSGSRFLSGQGRPEGMSRLHNFGNRVLSAISSVRNRRRISDLCTGLWGFNSQSLMKMDVKSRGFDLEAELAGIARRQGLDHIEVQVDWSQRKGGTSKLRSLTDGFIIFLRIIRT